MRISHFFIDRPIFASVVSIVFVILGGVAFSRLPVAQYPEIAPPTITVSGQYPGASADVVAATVVTPIEQQINGVENMIYLSSNSTGDGRFTISVSFEIGTNLDIAQVQVQNRVTIAQPRLPVDVRNIGVTVQKSSPDLMMVVHLYSPDKSRDTLFISNYATIEITDALTRVDGVGSLIVFGSRDYAMRAWLDPDRLQSLGLTAAGRQTCCIPNFGTDARAALQQRGVRQHCHQADGECRGAAEGCCNRRACRAGLFDQFISRPRSGDRDRHLPAARIQRAFDRYKHQEYDGRAGEAVPAGTEIRHRLQSDGVHSAIGGCSRIHHR
jgi:hypothetical protein